MGIPNSNSQLWDKKIRTMAMRAFPTSLLCALCASLCVKMAAGAHHSERISTVLKVPYFSTVSMLCDDASLSLVNSSDVQSLSWIFPDGTTVHDTDSVMTDRISFTPPTQGASISMRTMSAYNLTIVDISDMDFGYYTCVIVYTANSNRKRPVSAVRFGLNTDGADFSRLIEEYEENAIVGGIAAGVMLLLVGGGCLLWNFRFANRKSDQLPVTRGHHSNMGFKADLEMTSVADDEKVKAPQA